MRAARFVRWGVAVVALSGGCGKTPVEAPKELGDLGLFLFRHFEDEDPAEEAAGLLNLRDQVLAMDLSLEAKDLAVTMPVLSGDNLGGLSIPTGVDPEAQIPIAIGGMSSHGLDDQMALVLEPNQVCIESESTEWAERSFLTDTGCFEGATCDRLEVSQEVYKSNFLATVWYDQLKNYRWFDLEDEDGNESRALVGRSWIERSFPAEGGGGNSWDQLFHLDAYIEDPANPGETVRWFSLWSSVTLGGVGDDLYASLVVEGIGEALVFGDEFIAGAIESCKNDRDLAKPPRE